MKREILFIQGGGKDVHDEWDHKLVESLQRELGQNYEIRYPRMPVEDDPAYTRWKAALEDAFQTLHDGAILVGHSVGGTILINLLAEEGTTRTFSTVCLVALPFVGDGGWSSDDLRFPPDLGARLPKGVPIHFFHGLGDEIVPPSHIDLYARAVPQAHVHRLKDRNHQLNDDLREVAATILSLEIRH